MNIKSDLIDIEDRYATMPHLGMETRKLNAINKGASVLMITATAIMPASMAANDTITVCKIPANARIIPALSSITSEGVGTLTLSVGVESSASAYSVGQAVTTAGIYPFKTGTVDTAIPTVKTTIIATASGTPAVTAGKKLVFNIAYVIQ